jgi:hypothetical protein
VYLGYEALSSNILPMSQRCRESAKFNRHHRICNKHRSGFVPNFRRVPSLQTRTASMFLTGIVKSLRSHHDH